ncbi:methionine-R-sulfoxide reductase [Planoprotostelium fungivorum]|uniref:Peptide methionine sulfoxide reductase B1, chloroplastic n=1 Tax=Planoprotostelium fungivorum TaxID=1890364 RepID=A0A2P6N0I2_9EUKA|nr:methionine-R-sulfoxide reductase [Planoprotostelium fungivorum]
MRGKIYFTAVLFGAALTTLALRNPLQRTPVSISRPQIRNIQTTSEGTRDWKKLTEEEWKSRLDPQTFRVTRQAGTERPWTSDFNFNKKDGTYTCACCDTPLFDSNAKFESGSGWPSFFQPVKQESIEEHSDFSFGMRRTEVNCRTCGCHLGHVFNDGPSDKTGLRYCINGVSLNFKDEEKNKEPLGLAEQKRDEAEMASNEVMLLAQRYQSGEISQADLLKQLAQLHVHHTDARVASTPPQRKQASGSLAPPAKASTPTSTEDRKLMIQRLLQEKRNEIRSSVNSSDVEEPLKRPQPSPRTRRDNVKNSLQRLNDLDVPVPSSPIKKKPPETTNSKIASSNQINLKRTPKKDPPKPTTPTQGTKLRSSAMKAQAKIPPALLGSFYDKSINWNADREKRLRQQQVQKAEQDKRNSSHSFRPMINPQSESMIPEEKKVSIVERINQSACVLSLNNIGQIKDYTNPETSKPAQSRFRQFVPAWMKAEARVENHPDLTFRPQTNPVPQKMGKAQEFLQEKAHVRLSRSSSQSFKTPKGKDTISERPKLQRSNSTQSLRSAVTTNVSRPTTPRAPSTPTLKRRNSVGEISTTSKAQSTEESFGTFLRRQQNHINKQEKSKTRIIEKEAPKPPQLNKKSLDMAGRKGETFMQRLEQDNFKREQVKNDKVASTKTIQSRNMMNISKLIPQPDESFHPQILPTSKHLRRRSWAEMSTGDSLKKQLQQIAAREKAVQDELEKVTFEPNINEIPGVQSRLRILSEPESYLDRLKREQELKDFKNQEKLVAKSMREISDCTFRPETREAPEFVKRIARELGPTKKPKPSPSNPLMLMAFRLFKFT